jgi:hypothetical protein
MRIALSQPPHLVGLLAGAAHHLVGLLLGQPQHLGGPAAKPA